jgi:hypothetical protein
MKKFIQFLFVLVLLLWTLSALTLVNATTLDFKSWVDSVKVANGLELVYSETANIHTAQVAFGIKETLWNIYSKTVSKPVIAIKVSVDTNITVNTVNQATRLIRPFKTIKTVDIREILDLRQYSIDLANFKPETLTIGDTLVANRDYTSIKVKGKNIRLSAEEFDKLFDSRKVKQVKNKVWVRVASTLPKIRKLQSKSSNKPSSFRWSFSEIFTGGGCKK